MPITVDNLVVVPAAGSCPALWKAKSALAFAFPLTPRQCPVGGSPQAAAAAAWSLASHPAGWGLPRVPGGVLTTHCEVRDFMVTCGQRSGPLGLNLEAVPWEPGTEPKAGK